MAKISLKSIIDDILLLVRNNNISESEDLSRAQIFEWVKAYRNKLWEDEKNRMKNLALSGNADWQSLVDDDYLKKIEVGPMELESVESSDDTPSYTKRTIDTLENVLFNNEIGILAVYDESGENIQYMDRVRRHYQYWRKYTFGDMTAFYKDDGHIYIQGLVDKDMLKYIYVTFLQDIDVDEENEDLDEEDVLIPAWMVPMIKEMIMKSELAFMLNRPSDDSNNATLASVKPHGPQDDEQ